MLTRVLARVASLLRWEDLLLAAIAVVVLPAVEALLPMPAGDPAGAPSQLEGLVGLAAAGGVVACLLTRGPGEPAPLAGSTLSLQGWARFPLAAGVGIVALETLPGIGLDGEPFGGLAFLAVLASVLLHPLLPVVPVATRRLLVAPMVALAAVVFDRIVGSGLGDLVGDLVSGQAPQETTAFLPLILGAVGVVYAMLVVAPRAIADPGASGGAWTVRFLVMLAAVAGGQVVSRALGAG